MIVAIKDVNIEYRFMRVTLPYPWDFASEEILTIHDIIAKDELCFKDGWAENQSVPVRSCFCAVACAATAGADSFLY